MLSSAVIRNLSTAAKESCRQLQNKSLRQRLQSCEKLSNPAQRKLLSLKLGLERRAYITYSVSFSVTQARTHTYVRAHTQDYTQDNNGST